MGTARESEWLEGTPSARLSGVLCTKRSAQRCPPPLFHPHHSLLSSACLFPVFSMGKAATAFKDIGKACSGASSIQPPVQDVWSKLSGCRAGRPSHEGLQGWQVDCRGEDKDFQWGGAWLPSVDALRCRGEFPSHLVCCRVRLSRRRARKLAQTSLPAASWRRTTSQAALRVK